MKARQQTHWATSRSEKTGCGLAKKGRKTTVRPGDVRCKRCQRAIAVSPATTAEPAPVRTDSPAVWPLVVADVPKVLDETPFRVRARVVADMIARDAEGRRKYGIPLQVENGRNAAVDAYQEALDLTVYARQQWERHHTRAWWTIHEDALRLAARICAELMGGA